MGTRVRNPLPLCSTSSPEKSSTSETKSQEETHGTLWSIFSCTEPSLSKRRPLMPTLKTKLMSRKRWRLVSSTRMLTPPAKREKMMMKTVRVKVKITEKFDERPPPLNFCSILLFYNINRGLTSDMPVSFEIKGLLVYSFTE